jgi:hypothetical protein
MIAQSYAVQLMTDKTYTVRATPDSSLLRHATNDNSHNSAAQPITAHKFTV